MRLINDVKSNKNKIIITKDILERDLCEEFAKIM